MRKRVRRRKGKRRREPGGRASEEPSGVSRETPRAVTQRPSPQDESQENAPPESRKNTSLGRGQRNPNGTKHAASGIIERGDFDAGEAPEAENGPKRGTGRGGGGLCTDE